jgi:hypothetical protein
MRKFQVRKPAVLSAVWVTLFLLAPAGFSQQSKCILGTFPSYLDFQPGQKPPGYDGPVFSLSQNYPQQLPPKGAYPWLRVAVKNGVIQDPQAYLLAVKKYVLEGNTDVDFDFQKNKVRPWFHFPWMHFGPTGREFVHGLTHEIDSQPGYLDNTYQKNWGATWAVSGINDRGGYAVGQVWCDPQKPNPLALNPDPNAPNSMPDGSTQVKLLFTSASAEDVPWLKGSLEWQGDINQFAGGSLNPVKCPPPSFSCPDPAMSCNLGVCFLGRKISTVRLMQMDVAVRDDRIKETGWAFGTFAYNVKSPGTSVWDKLMPIGLMWGNDPGVTPEMVSKGTKLKESWINPAAQPLQSKGIFGGGNHLGYAGRLNGPADDVNSSCMSCHMVAGLGAPAAGSIVPSTVPLVPAAVDPNMPVERKLSWFVNLPAGVSLGYQTEQSLDYSLQLTLGITRFYQSKAATPAQGVQVHQVTRGSASLNNETKK